jgi:hypothetical protein
MRSVAPRLFPLVILAVLLALPLTGHAADALGDASVGMSERLICSTFSILQGDIGLLAGFAIGIYGLLTVIRGSLGFGLFLVVAGALTTAVPGAIASGLGALQGVIENTGLSSGGNMQVGGALEDVRSKTGNCDAIGVDMSAYKNVPFGSALNPNGTATGVPGTVLDSAGNYGLGSGNFSGDTTGTPGTYFGNTNAAGAGSGSFNDAKTTGSFNP